MKLGILTFHCAHNYGAILQCLALQEYLKSLGHHVNILDYRPWYLVKIYQKNSFRLWISRTLPSTIKKLGSELKVHQIRKKRFDNFNNFIGSKLNLAPYPSDMNFSDYDAIFIGSDQVWDKEICGGQYDPVFFGQNFNCPVIPYAVSNKITSLSELDKYYFKQNLKKYFNISVREKKLQELLQPLTSKTIYHVVDPTLLAGTLLTDKIENKRIIKEKYILIYEIVEHEEVLYRAKAFAEEHGYRVIILNAFLTADKLDMRDQEASPGDFINYIRYAECVFTTSFHGTALSIILKRNFYSFRQHNNSDVRIQSLLDILGLQERFIEFDTDINNKPIDYYLVDIKLNKNVENSKQFINQALFQIEKN